MATLTRWDPFREMMTVREAMDRFFDEPILELPRLRARGMQDLSLALDVAEDENEYLIEASVPGIKPDDIEITVTDNVLTIKGETKEEKEVEEKNYHLRERRFGSFSRSVTLPTAVDADKVEAYNEHGVLTLHLPKVEAVKPKKITVKKQISSK